MGYHFDEARQACLFSFAHRCCFAILTISHIQQNGKKNNLCNGGESGEGINGKNLKVFESCESARRKIEVEGRGKNR